jgi:hypothetical protein
MIWQFILFFDHPYYSDLYARPRPWEYWDRRWYGRRLTKSIIQATIGTTTAMVLVRSVQRVQYLKTTAPNDLIYRGEVAFVVRPSDSAGLVSYNHLTG